MAMKNISDTQVLQAYILSKRMLSEGERKWPYEILQDVTGECLKVCYRACERANNRGYIDYGISLRSGWISDKGFELLGKEKEE